MLYFAYFFPVQSGINLAIELSKAEYYGFSFIEHKGLYKVKVVRMKKILLSILTFAVAAIFLPAVSGAGSIGGPHLWLSIDPANYDESGIGYVKADQDPWLTDSYVTNDNSFNLYIYNAAKYNPKKNLIAENISLLITTPEGESGNVKVNDKSYSVFSGTTLPKAYGAGSHGIYKKSTGFNHDGFHAIAFLGADLLPETVESVEIEWSGFSKVHFDVFSSNEFYNPPGHDVTAMIPIPSSLLLFGSGIVGLVGLGFRRRFKN